MKKTIVAVILMAFSNVYYSQVGIRTSAPDATLDVVGKLTVTNAPDGVIAPRLTGNQLKAKDNAYGTKQTGTIVYATSAASPTSAKTINVTEAGYYYFDGTVWIGFTKSVSNEATRYLGGTVFVRFNQATGGSLIPEKTLGGGASNYGYAVGLLAQTATKGGVNEVWGRGYTVSNPANGIFDIHFDKMFLPVYGVSANIVDAYGPGSSNVPNGSNTNFNEPGARLATNDNAQVAFISNGIIRIKTGDASGKLANRPFTFLVIGR